MIIVNAYGQPHMAARIEAAIGKAMATHAYREGHRARLPEGTTYVPPPSRSFPFDEMVVDYIRANPGCSVRSIVANTPLTRGSVESVVRRLTGVGAIRRKQFKSRAASEYFVQGAPANV